MIEEISELRDKVLLLKESPIYSSDTENGRIYQRPTGEKYASVTTVLGKMKDQTSLNEWRSRIGEDEAKRITEDAAARGSDLHYLTENYLFGKDVPCNNKLALKMFKTIKPHLNKISVIDVEFPLWSDYLRIAGRTDCLGFYDGKLSIIDFKTSRKEKLEAWIKDYFLQTTLYSLMLFERTGIRCEQVVLIIAVESGFPQLFRRPIKNYTKEAIQLVHDYHKKFPN